MKKKNKKELIRRTYTEDEVIKYISSIEKDELLYPSDLVFEFGMDYDEAEKMLDELVKKDTLEKH